ncbi:MAG: choice-of-anchor B family protein [Bacteroidetes bacterium]|nr:choice-of-anchor B family protein [Bacteroidota bacterium]
MKQFLLSVALFASTAITLAQTPCENGMAGDYPCEGYDLQSFIPWTTFGATNANDSWGWTDPEDGTEYALVGVRNGVAFVDISDPVNPLYLGKLPTHTTGSLWRDVKVYGNYAFVVSEAGGHGMQVFDLTRLRDVSNPPETFTEDAHEGSFGSAHNVVINEEAGYAYPVGTSLFNGGPVFINISDPLNPVFEGGYGTDAYSHDGQVVTYNGPDTDYAGREIYIGSNTNEVVIVDITDKSNPQNISSIGYSNISYTHQGWFTDDHQYFILGDEIDELDFGFNTRNIIFDFSDLDNPSLHFEYTGPTPATDHNAYVNGDLLYLANYTAGMRVIDISDIDNANANEIGYFDIYPENNIAGYNGAWNVYPYFESGNILITSLTFSDADYVGGMHIVKSNTLSVTDQSLTKELALYPNPTNGQLTIATTNTPISSIAIFDLLGKILLEDSGMNVNNKTLDISNLAAGVYYVTVNGTATKKIIKQ